MKKVTLPINIYTYEANSRKLALKIMGLMSILVLLADLTTIQFLENYQILLYTFLFRIIFLIPYIFISKSFYKKYIYMPYAMIIMTAPSFFLAYLVFFKDFGFLVASIILFLYIISMYLMYHKSIGFVKIDYQKAAQNLINKYPQDLESVYVGFYANSEIREKKTQTNNQKKAKENNIIVNIFTHIPIGMIPVLSIGIAELMLVYLSDNTSAYIFMLIFLFLCVLIIITGFLKAYRNKILFKTAQEMIDEEVKRRDSVRKNK